jgi:hypothetical protein
VLQLAPLARAADLRVALVRAPQADIEASSAAATYGRIRAELLAGGLSVVMLVEADATSEATLESAAVRVRSIAAIGVAMTAADQPEAYVWLTPGPDRAGEMVQVQVGASGEEGDRLLALRVADLLFASLVELEPLRRKREGGDAADLEPPPSLSEPPPKKETPRTEEARKPEPSPKEPVTPPPLADEAELPPDLMADVALGGSAFVSFAGLPATFAPTVTGGWWLGRRWRVGGMFSGPAAGKLKVQGIADVDFDQEMLATDVHFVAIATKDFSLHTIFGAGAFRMAVQGQPHETNPLQPGSDTTFQGLGLVGASGRVVLAEPLWSVGRVDAAFITRPPRISAPAPDVASVGIPLLMFTVMFGMSW